MTQRQADCKHSRRGRDTWVDEVGEFGEWGYEPSHWEYGYDEDTFEDISISQYKCTQCGLTFNYSGGNPHHVLDKG